MNKNYFQLNNESNAIISLNRIETLKYDGYTTITVLFEGNTHVVEYEYRDMKTASEDYIRLKGVLGV